MRLRPNSRQAHIVTVITSPDILVLSSTITRDTDIVKSRILLPVYIGGVDWEAIEGPGARMGN